VRDKLQSLRQARSEFLALLSHELRTPLTSVIGFSNVLLRDSATRTRAQEITYLERIRANGIHLLSLIEELFASPNIETGKEELEVSVGAPREDDARVGRSRPPEHPDAAVRREPPALESEEKTSD
jgi:signal transduction histidine kinase